MGVAMEYEGLILAAGLSSRAGVFKMTLQLKGKTVIENVIDSMRMHCSRVIVVGGYRIEELQPIIKPYDRVELVFNESYQQGMYSSIKKGMSLIKAERFFYTPGDYPLIEAEVYEELQKHSSSVVIPTFEERKGHPLLLSWEIARQVLENENYENLREVIKANNPLMVPVKCRGITMDLDTIEDYKLLLKEIEGVGL
jgi:molybdenum cofactor cytidylyltransferase